MTCPSEDGEAADSPAVGFGLGFFNAAHLHNSSSREHKDAWDFGHRDMQTTFYLLQHCQAVTALKSFALHEFWMPVFPAL